MDVRIAEYQEIIEALKIKPYYEVSEVTGLSISALQRLAKSSGIDKRRKHSDQQLADAVEYSKTHTILETSIKTGISTARIVTERRRMGVSKNGGN